MANRRNFIKNASLVGIVTAGAASSCVSASQSLKWAESAYRVTEKRRKFPKIKVSLDRVVKETVGLRPFRTKGPRIAKQSLDKKHIIHNYGHGGSGWSLSWGTSARAVDLAESTGARQFAILGCGVIGLATATILQQKGYPVSIYTQALPPDITSSKATGTWSPSHYLIDDEYLDKAFLTQWEQDCRLSFKMFQNQLGLEEQVEWVDAYGLSREDFPRGNSPFSLPDLLPKGKRLSPGDHPFYDWQVTRQPRMMFNIPRYLKGLMDGFLAFGGKISIREFHSLEEVDSLPEPCVMNCLGLGAREVFGDENLIPVAGQLSFLLPQPELNYCLMTPGGYAIPRKDGIVLGGNHIRGSWDTTPSREQTEKVVAALRNVTEQMVF